MAVNTRHPFSFEGVLLSTSPVGTFTSKKDPSRQFRRWCLVVRADSGFLVVVSDWDPPAVLPQMNIGGRVRVDFGDTQRCKDVPDGWTVRGSVTPLK